MNNLILNLHLFLMKFFMWAMNFSWIIWWYGILRHAVWTVWDCQTLFRCHTFSLNGNCPPKVLLGGYIPKGEHWFYHTLNYIYIRQLSLHMKSQISSYEITWIQRHFERFCFITTTWNYTKFIIKCFLGFQKCVKSRWVRNFVSC